jgi:hypothetical protein
MDALHLAICPPLNGKDVEHTVDRTILQACICEGNVGIMRCEFDGAFQGMDVDNKIAAFGCWARVAGSSWTLGGVLVSRADS